MSLVRRANGRYLALDACGLVPETRALLDEKTRGGEELEAFLHLHPFHTLHVRKLHQLYPRARLYGTARHHTQLPDLPWDALRTEDPALHAHFAADLDFTVPRGVDLVTPNPRVHFGSVLAIHQATRTLHVDDTLIYAKLPRPLRAQARRPPLSSGSRRRAASRAGCCGRLPDVGARADRSRRDPPEPVRRAHLHPARPEEQGPPDRRAHRARPAHRRARAAHARAKAPVTRFLRPARRRSRTARADLLPNLWPSGRSDLDCGNLL